MIIILVIQQAAFLIRAYLIRWINDDDRCITNRFTHGLIAISPELSLGDVNDKILRRNLLPWQP